jgi:hypothetical protein
MSDHSIVAPCWRSAGSVASYITGRGYHARVTKYGKHHIVLAIAPLDVVETACRRYSVGGL